MDTVLTLHRSTMDQPIHEEVSAFAARGYHKRYGITLHAVPDIFVYATATDGHIVSCFGAYRKQIKEPLTAEWYIAPDALSEYLGTPLERFPIAKLFEVGTRVVDLPPGIATNSIRTSVAMAAALLLNLRKEGGTHSLFTADRSVNLIARQLEVTLEKFGPVDLSRREKAYQEHWQAYFEVPRECYGFNLNQAAKGCLRACEQLQATGFKFADSLFHPTSDDIAVAG